MSNLGGESDQLASPALLRKIDELREKNIGQHVPLPQLVVVGDQSSGKSSVLESLTKISFPRDLGLCTRYATQITSRRDRESSVEISIIPGPSADDEHRRRVTNYRPTIRSAEEFHVKFPEILREANIRMGIRTDLNSNDGSVFSEDVLKIEKCGPNEDYLTIIDVPGIFRKHSEGVTTKEDVALVRNMVEGYIKDCRTIILAVLPSNIDVATQEILTLAEDYDMAGERTLGVLTKPDLVKEHSAKHAVCDLVRGKRQQLALGYHVIQNRGADDDSGSSHRHSEHALRKEPWCNLPNDKVGAQALRVRLGELLGHITHREFPRLRKDVKEQLADCRTEMESLGPTRQTEHEQRLFLSSTARQFQDMVEAALNAHYHRHEGFEELEALRLITHVVNFTEVFRRDFHERAQSYYFEASRTPRSDAETDSINYSDESDASPDVSAEQTFTLDNDDTDPVLENIVSDDDGAEYPQDSIMDWIGDLHRRSRGVDLGTFGGSILSSAFKDQSRKWNGMTKVYMSNVIKAIHRFMLTALKEVCNDAQVREEIWSSICGEVLSRYSAATDLAAFLVSMERDKRPYTLNHYFNECLQISRGKRMAELLKPKSKRDIQHDTWGEQSRAPRMADNLVDLDSVRHATTNKSNVEHVKEEIHDILRSYYKVARKRFVDNVYQQAVDHSLLTGPKSPLAVFSQEWAVNLSGEQLDAIAGESPTTKERRAALDKKIEDLEDALRILRHHL